MRGTPLETAAPATAAANAPLFQPAGGAPGYTGPPPGPRVEGFPIGCACRLPIPSGSLSRPHGAPAADPSIPMAREVPEDILMARREIEVARAALQREKEALAGLAGRPSALPPGVRSATVTGASAAPVSTAGNAAQAAGMPFPERVSQGVAPDQAARGQPVQADVPTGSDPWSMQDPRGRCSSHVGQGSYFAGLPTPAVAPALTMGPQGAMYCPIGTPPGSPQRDGRAGFDARKPVFDTNIARDSKYQYDKNGQEA